MTEAGNGKIDEVIAIARKACCDRGMTIREAAAVGNDLAALSVVGHEHYDDPFRLDADGVPIFVGDVLYDHRLENRRFEVCSLTGTFEKCIRVKQAGRVLDIDYYPEHLHHSPADSWEKLRNDLYEVYADEAFHYGCCDADEAKRDVDEIIARAKALGGVE